jgi:Plavaka transposase
MPEHNTDLWSTPIRMRPPSETDTSSQPHQSQVAMPEYNTDLWSMPIRMRPPSETETTLTSLSTPAENIPSQEYSDNMEGIVFEEPLENKKLEDLIKEPRYNLRSQAQDIESENIEVVIEEPMEFKDNTFDPEDLQGATLDDALDTNSGKNKPDRIAEWPNDAYRDFMNLIIEGNISNNIGDKIINFFNKHSNLEKSPLPKSTKNGKDYLNQINSPSVGFKEKVVANYSGVDIKLYYRPIFRSIQALIQRPEVVENFVCKGTQKFSQNREGETRIFGEQYECDWWLKTEKTLPPLNNLLSIILYSDATTLMDLERLQGIQYF